MSDLILPMVRCADNASFFDEAVNARLTGQHLVHRGDGEVFLSPIVYPGWFKVGVSVKPQRKAA